MLYVPANRVGMLWMGEPAPGGRAPSVSEMTQHLSPCQRGMPALHLGHSTRLWSSPRSQVCCCSCSKQNEWDGHAVTAHHI